MSNIAKVLDRVRKLLALADNAGSEAEAANAAGNAAKLMEEYQLSEALVRLDEPAKKAEPILKGELLENARQPYKYNRVAWKEAIARAVASDLGVKMYFNTSNDHGRSISEVVGMGRESAIQAWRYTYQYLCRAVEEMCEASREREGYMDKGSSKAWNNAFRVACASRLAVRLEEARKAKAVDAKAAVEEAMPNITPEQRELALTVVERDNAEVDREYADFKKGFGPAVRSVGQVSSRSGYDAGQAAGDRISLGGGRAGLTAGQGRLT